MTCCTSGLTVLANSPFSAESCPWSSNVSKILNIPSSSIAGVVGFAWFTVMSEVVRVEQKNAELEALPSSAAEAFIY